MNKVASAYFDLDEITSMTLKQDANPHCSMEETEETAAVHTRAVTMQRTRKILASKRKIGRSVSLPDQGEQSGTTHAASLTHEMLFFGTGINTGKSGHNRLGQRFRSSNEAQGDSKLKKKGKGPVNNVFRAVK